MYSPDVIYKDASIGANYHKTFDTKVSETSILSDLAKRIVYVITTRKCNHYRTCHILDKVFLQPNRVFFAK